MTIKRTMLPVSLITSGLVLAGFGSSGYLAAPADQAKTERASIMVRATVPPNIDALRGRMRFVAVENAPDRYAKEAATKPATAATLPQRKRGTSSAKAPKDRHTQQQAAFDWPWNLFAK